MDELNWTAKNPDFNHIEHLWNELGKETYSTDFTDALIAEQKEISADRFQNIVESLLIRVQAVKAE